MPRGEATARMKRISPRRHIRGPGPNDDVRRPIPRRRVTCSRRGPGNPVAAWLGQRRLCQPTGWILVLPREGLSSVSSSSSSVGRRNEAVMWSVARVRVPALLGMSVVFGWMAAASPFAGNPAASATRDEAADSLDRTVLPIPEPKLAADHDARRPQRQGPAAIPGQGSGEGPQRAHRADRRHGLRPVERLRRADPHADAGANGEGRAALQPVPHHGALLADPRGPADRPQPSRLQHGLDHGDRHRVPRPDRAAPEQRGSAGRDAAAQRLQHGRLRQVARDRRLGSQPLRPDRPLADPLRLRQVLRLHRRRNEPVVPGHLRRHEPRSNCRRIRTTTS